MNWIVFLFHSPGYLLNCGYSMVPLQEQCDCVVHLGLEQQRNHSTHSRLGPRNEVIKVILTHKRNDSEKTEEKRTKNWKKNYSIILRSEMSLQLTEFFGLVNWHWLCFCFFGAFIPYCVAYRACIYDHLTRYGPAISLKWESHTGPW